MDTVEYIARENTDANKDLVLVATVHSVSIRRCPSSSCFNLVVSASSASIHIIDVLPLLAVVIALFVCVVVGYKALSDTKPFYSH